jgi:hypothetical protein
MATPTSSPPSRSRLAPPVHDGFAVASLVLGSILALVFGTVSANEAHRAGRKESGMATWGRMLGGLGSSSS